MPWSGIGATVVGGSLMGGLSGLFSAAQYQKQKKLDSKAYKRQVALLQMQQAWSERMANTAHQREVKDLRAAGLNPILSATGGNGAMVPAVGASAVSTGSHVERPDSPNFDLAGAMNTASATDLNNENAKKVAEEAKLTKELLETEKLRQGQIRAQTAKTTAETAGTLSENKGKTTKGKVSDIIGGLLDTGVDLFSSAKSRKETASGLKESFLYDPMTFISPGGKLLKEAYHGLTGKIPATPGSRIREGVKRLKRGTGKLIWNTLFKKKRK